MAKQQTGKAKTEVFADSLAEALEISQQPEERSRYNLTLDEKMTARVRIVARTREVPMSIAATWLLNRSLEWWDTLPPIQKQIA